MTEKLSECCQAKVKIPEMRCSGNYGCSCGKTYRIEAQAAFLRCQKSHPKYAGTCSKCGKPCTIAKPDIKSICPECGHEFADHCANGDGCHIDGCKCSNDPDKGLELHPEIVAKLKAMRKPASQQPDASPERLLTDIFNFIAEHDTHYRSTVKEWVKLAFEAGRKSRDNEIIQIETQAWSDGHKVGRKEQAEKDRAEIEQLQSQLTSQRQTSFRLTEALAEAEKRGARELAEWANKGACLHYPYGHLITKCTMCWQAKLKSLEER